MKEETNELDILKAQIHQLIEDKMELYSRLEMHDELIDLDKPVRKLTLQEKLELNMGEQLKKFRIPTKDIKKMYYSIIKSAAEEKEPDSVDVSFNSQRYLTAFYIVDAQKEQKEIEKGENVGLDISKIPDDMPELQHQYDIMTVVNQLTDISANVGRVTHDSRSTTIPVD